jgi:hypothetical protein
MTGMTPNPRFDRRAQRRRRWVPVALRRRPVNRNVGRRHKWVAVATLCANELRFQTEEDERWMSKEDGGTRARCSSEF